MNIAPAPETGVSSASSKHLPEIRCVEGISKVFDRGMLCTVWPDDRHDIESGPTLERSILLKPAKCCLCQVSLFGPCDRLSWKSVLIRLAGLHFDEDDRDTIPADEIQFPPACGVIPCQDPHSLLFPEIPFGSPFSAVSKQSAGKSRHVTCPAEASDQSA